MVKSFSDRETFGWIGPRAVALAQSVKVAFFDFDGVFTNNTTALIGGRQIKSRSYYDGQGVSLLRAIGIPVVIITNENADSARLATFLVSKWNGLSSSSIWPPVSLFTGCGGEKKLVVAQEFLSSVGVELTETVMMGDDLVDVPLLRAVGFKASPPTAELVIRNMSDFTSHRPAGAGAVRDLANFILASRGIDPLGLPCQ